MRKIGLLLVSLAACSSGPRLPKTAQGTPAITVGGAVKGGPYALGRADLDKLPRRSVRGIDPASGREAVWEGTAADEIVGRRVEPMRGADLVLVRTADRAAIAIPLTILVQSKPVLADHADGARIATNVLAWPTLEQRGLETDPRASLWWARDVVAIDLVDSQKTFGPALATPDGAVDGARRGSALFGERCIACHRMRGIGGQRGPELTMVAARMRQAPFIALLDKHPGWKGTGGDPPGEQGARELWSFLHAVAVAAPNAPSPDPVTAERGDAR
ncbi:MAG TPA: c-type cytochrome [Anaeromyxobacter sp.]